MAIKELAIQAGGWFKPKDALGSVAILLDVKSFEHQRPTANGPKDSVLADVSTFHDMESISMGRPTVSKGQRIEQTVLARALQDVVGFSTIVVLDQVPATKPGAYPAWVFRNLMDPAAHKGITEYVSNRDAGVESAMNDAPDFD